MGFVDEVVRRRGGNERVELGCDGEEFGGGTDEMEGVGMEEREREIGGHDGSAGSEVLEHWASRR